jgi:hypothetical protein
MQDCERVSIGLDPEDRPIWGVKAIAEVLGLEERQAWYLVQTKRIPIGRAGSRIFSTARALKKTFAVEAQ